jgi:hypothetical protein
MFKFIIFSLLLYMLYRLIKNQIIVQVKRDMPGYDREFRGKDITKEARIIDEEKHSGR